MLAIGVDGCSSGWIYASLGAGLDPFGVVPNLSSLINKIPDDAVVFVDIPISLWEESGHARNCDTAARRLLGQRGSSVFPAPPRAILDAKDYDDALKRSRALTGKGLSKQAFAIFPKIREVDNLLASDPRARMMIREIHPELCFWAFAGGSPMNYSKKKLEGFEERMCILEKVLPEARAMASSALRSFKRKEVARDDIVDALVALATAASDPKFLATLPETPELDSKDISMEMVFNCKYVLSAL
jgi:predicted RNase H-like nuclease